MDLVTFAYDYFAPLADDARAQWRTLDFMGVRTEVQSAAEGSLDFADSPPHVLFVDAEEGAVLSLETVGAASDTLVMLCSQQGLTLRHVVEDRDEAFDAGCALLRVTSEGVVQLERVRRYAERAEFEVKRE